MLFGLRNAAQTFQYFMDQVLRGLDFCYTYIDDVSKTPADHKIHLHLVFECFVPYGILINPAKCVLGVNQIRFVAYHVNNKDVPLPEQVQIIRDFPQPTSLHQLREFLNFYH